MRRYTPLFLVSFILLVLVLAGNIYLAGYADNHIDKNQKSITVYTTLPVEHIAILADAYETTHQVKIHFIPLTEKELIKKFTVDAVPMNDSADAVIANKEVLVKIAKAKVFSNYSSEQTDIISSQFKDEQGAWVGIWYDPIVICANKDYLKMLPKIPSSWDDITNLNQVRLGITDFLAADASANLLFTLVAEYDEEKAFTLLAQLHPKVVQYAKYLATPVRMAGMGEVDIAIAVQSETIRYINDNFPISMIYPSEGTSYMLTGVGILKSTKNKIETKQFVNWLVQDDVQLYLQKNKFFFVPTNQETVAYKMFTGKNLKLFENYSDLTVEQKSAVLDRWVKNVRLKERP
ncbi:ABC transporter substrate-binding protein [Anaerosinus massiliensis]|uniref:ABC transporter substrate-binding protein n=1 Tax=Massilibacillus massiliensis TaxID=1806837 RepID=UPI000A4752C2|nr:extracellular solute-binding protein [Massilibacillus massiliensis]